MNRGALYAALAYALWGVAPIYFRQLTAVSPFEIVLHRSVWALLFLLAVLAVSRRWAWLRAALSQPRQVALFALSSILLTGNWTLFVWAVNSHRVIEASLGYFINPLVNVVLGYAVLHERLRPVQWSAVALAGAGVLWLAWQAGQPPWIALALAGSFGVYALLRKLAPLGALEGLTMETMLMAVVALPLLVLWTWQGSSALAGADGSLLGWLMLAGPVTAVPLLLFGAGARRITLATLGVLQYIGPSLQFVLGVWLYKEPFSRTQMIGFGLIWLALVVYSAESWRHARGRATKLPAEPASTA